MRGNVARRGNLLSVFSARARGRRSVAETGELTRGVMRTGFLSELREAQIWLNYKCGFGFFFDILKIYTIKNHKDDL